MTDSALVVTASVFKPAIAVHEAGHAVISRREGIASAWVILREDGTGEHRWTGTPLDPIDIDAVVLPRDRHLVESVVRVLLGGNAAQFKAYPGSAHSDGHDLDQARVLLAPFVEIDQRFDPSTDVERYLDLLRKQVRATLAVEGVWREVTALAQELLANGRLEGDEIIRVCEAASRPAPVPVVNPPASGTRVKDIIHDKYGRITRIIEHEAEPSATTP
jgi:hypothetical protein